MLVCEAPDPGTIHLTELLRPMGAHTGRVHLKDHIPLVGAPIQRALTLGTALQGTRRVGPFLRKTWTSLAEKLFQLTGAPLLRRPAAHISRITRHRRQVARSLWAAPPLASPQDFSASRSNPYGYLKSGLSCFALYVRRVFSLEQVDGTCSYCS